MGASDFSLAGGLALERGTAPPRTERRSAPTPTLAQAAAAHTAPAAYQPAGRSPVGIAAVIGLHLLLGYALVSGLAREVVNVIKAPIETRLIEEVKPPPPPPEILPPPRRAPPPPSFAPPPEVVVATPVAPTITTTQVAPPPTPVFIAPAAPEGPPVRPTGRPARIDVSSCDKPPYPDAAARAGAIGITKIRFTVDAVGAVASASVERSSGATREHRLLDKAAVAALSKCRFTPGTDEHGAPVGGFAVVDYQWQID